MKRLLSVCFFLLLALPFSFALTGCMFHTQPVEEQNKCLCYNAKGNRQIDVNYKLNQYRQKVRELYNKTHNSSKMQEKSPANEKNTSNITVSLLFISVIDSVYICSCFSLPRAA